MATNACGSTLQSEDMSGTIVSCSLQYEKLMAILRTGDGSGLSHFCKLRNFATNC